MTIASQLVQQASGADTPGGRGTQDPLEHLELRGLPLSGSAGATLALVIRRLVAWVKASVVIRRLGAGGVAHTNQHSYQPTPGSGSQLSVCFFIMVVWPHPGQDMPGPTIIAEDGV